MRLAQPSQCMSTLSTAVTMGGGGGGFFPSLSFPFAPFSCWSLLLVVPLLVLPVLVALRRRRVAGVGRLLLALLRRLLLLPAAAAATATPSTAAAALLLRSINTTPLVHYTIHRPGAMGSKENKNRESY
jgi:hypothetical protein